MHVQPHNRPNRVTFPVTGYKYNWLGISWLTKRCKPLWPSSKEQGVQTRSWGGSVGWPPHRPGKLGPRGSSTKVAAIQLLGEDNSLGRSFSGK